MKKRADARPASQPRVQQYLHSHQGKKRGEGGGQETHPGPLSGSGRGKELPQAFEKRARRGWGPTAASFQLARALWGRATRGTPRSAACFRNPCHPLVSSRSPLSFPPPPFEAVVMDVRWRPPSAPRPPLRHGRLESPNSGRIKCPRLLSLFLVVLCTLLLAFRRWEGHCQLTPW